jgi:uncharacterized protein YprB with RNaseH-like and TPR domain
MSRFLRRVIPYFHKKRFAGVQCSRETDVMGSKAERLVWFDLEMTGLDENRDHILEIACVITDKQLNIVAEVCVCIIRGETPILVYLFILTCTFYIFRV